MSDTFELLRRMAEDSREAARKLHAGIDPTTWEALLDRVEDQLEKEDRKVDNTSESDDVSAVGLPLSILASGALVAALTQPGIDTAGSGNTLAQCTAAGAALAALGLTALRARHGHRPKPGKEAIIPLTSRPA
ncbi:hypothetical protein [Streptomyces sp. NPDC059209]|uniref:hypothetical protein n=1 Tax=Streptomyces sp. NPDC059209 TaxID=3346769 RepID=UPI003689C1FF